MRLITAVLVAAGFAAAAGSASAAASDVEFLKANRCRGLAAGSLGEIDTAALDAYLKSEQRYRTTTVIDKAKAEMDKAKREAKTTNEERKTRLTAELNGPCQVYKG
jgi:hypothetical protein